MSRLFSLLLFLFSTTVFASWQIESLLEKRIEHKLKKIDTNVVVFVDYENIRREQKVESPFLKNIMKRSQKGRESIEVVVHTVNIDANQRRSMDLVIRGVMDDYSYEYNVHYQVLNKKNEIVKRENPKFIFENKVLNGFINKLDQVYIPRFTFGAGLAIVLLTLAFLSKGNSGPVQVIADKESVMSSPQEVEYEELRSKEEEKDFNHLSDEHLISFFADCYWCYEDSYAQYVWNRISADKRRKILLEHPFFPEYVAYVGTEQEKNEFFIDDSYYYRPLPISHLSNDDLAGLVMKDPSLMSRLSLVRRKSLVIDGKIKSGHFVSIRSSHKIENTHLERVKKSKERNFKVDDKSFFTNMRDEEEFFENISDYGASRKKLSLAWSRFIDDQRLIEVIAHFDLYDWGNAWVAPQRDLDRIKSLMSPEDQVRLDRILEVTEPTNRCGSFRRISLYLSNELLEKEIAA